MMTTYLGVVAFLILYIVLNNSLVNAPEYREMLAVGDPLNERTQMGPSNSESQLRTVMEYVRIGVDEGATIACGGHRLEGGQTETLVKRGKDQRSSTRKQIFPPVVGDIAHIPNMARERRLRCAGEPLIGVCGRPSGQHQLRRRACPHP